VEKPSRPSWTSLITFEHLRALEHDASRGFWEDVDVRDNPYDCWEWTKAQTNYYGRVSIPDYITGLDRTVMLHAHRVALSSHWAICCRSGWSSITSAATGCAATRAT
jgi:hypothetical protein